MENKELKPHFKQVCIWPGCIVEEHQIKEMEDFFKEEMDVRVQFLETIVTKPSICPHGLEIAGSGGRIDTFIAIHEEDVAKFAMPRFGLGIRWVEDVLGAWNGYDKNPIYPERVKGYMSWDDPELTTKMEKEGRDKVMKSIHEAQKERYE